MNRFRRGIKALSLPLALLPYLQDDNYQRRTKLANRLFSLSLYISLFILAIVMVVSPRLTNAQLALLEMFSFEMSEAEVLAMRQTLMQHFRTRLGEEVQKTTQLKGLTTAQLEEQMNFENRTKRLDQIRAAQ